MYKVLIPHSKKTGKLLGEIYYNKFVSTFRTALQRKLQYRNAWTVGVFGHKNDKVVMKLLPGSKAEAFIMHCIKSDHFMRLLLYGDMQQMEKLVQVLRKWVGNDLELIKLTDHDKLSLSKQQKHGLGPVCHFHSVIKRIFVDVLYEKELDKEWVYKRINLNRCPYCGDAPVFITDHVDADGNNVVSKRPLDHFLPKSVYPFFAVNIYNLFPCCERCNSDNIKGDTVPMEKNATGTWHWLIMHPHHFDERLLTFAYIPSSPLHPQDDIELACANDYLTKGYKNILGLEKLYKNYKSEARNMIVRASEYLTLHAIDYGKQTYGFDKKYLHHYVTTTLCFDPDKDKPKEVERYKFKMDIFMQIQRQYNIEIL